MITSIGVLSFITGLGVGVGVALIFRGKEHVEETVATEPVTADEVSSYGKNTILDGMKGLEIPGSVAKVFHVRMVGVERAKHVAMWGSKGRNGDEPTVFRRFADLPTEHLVNIRNNSLKATPDDRLIIESILEDRIASGEADESVLDY